MENKAFAHIAFIFRHGEFEKFKHLCPFFFLHPINSQKTNWSFLQKCQGQTSLSKVTWKLPPSSKKSNQASTSPQKSLQYQLSTMSPRPLTKKHAWQKLPKPGQWTLIDNFVSQPIRVCFVLFFWPIRGQQCTRVQQRRKARENSNCLNRNRGLVRST